MQVQGSYSAQANGVTMSGAATRSRACGSATATTSTGARRSVNNLFDRKYYLSLSNPGWNSRYGEPRNVMLTVRGQF